MFVPATVVVYFIAPTKVDAAQRFGDLKKVGARGRTGNEPKGKKRVEEGRKETNRTKEREWKDGRRGGKGGKRGKEGKEGKEKRKEREERKQEREGGGRGRRKEGERGRKGVQEKGG